MVCWKGIIKKFTNHPEGLKLNARPTVEHGCILWWLKYPYVRAGPGWYVCLSPVQEDGWQNYGEIYGLKIFFEIGT